MSTVVCTRIYSTMMSPSHICTSCGRPVSEHRRVDDEPEPSGSTADDDGLTGAIGLGLAVEVLETVLDTPDTSTPDPFTGGGGEFSGGGASGDF